MDAWMFGCLDGCFERYHDETTLRGLLVLNFQRCLYIKVEPVSKSYNLSIGELFDFFYSTIYKIMDLA